jgi:hypothetical protein
LSNFPAVTETRGFEVMMTRNMALTNEILQRAQRRNEHYFGVRAACQRFLLWRGVVVAVAMTTALRHAWLCTRPLGPQLVTRRRRKRRT